MTNTKSTLAKKVKRMSCKVPVRIVAVVLAVLLVMNVTSILTNLSVFAQKQEDYAVIGIEMNGKTSVVEYRAKDDCSLVVAVYDDDGAKMLGSGNTTVTVDKQSAEVEISIDEMPQDYLVKAFLVNPANNYPLCDAFSKTFPVIEEPTEDLPELYTPDGDNIAYASEENFYYMNNMVIIVFADDAQQSEIDSVIASINGKAVGKNKYINQYQVEIATHSLDELRDIITRVESNECVLFAHYDQVLANSENSISLDDPWDGNVDNEDWNDSDVDGSNWWLEAIDAPGAWEYNDFFSKIKIGIIDSGFDTGHEDLELTILNKYMNKKDDHGTHVSGIIGAKNNNGKGITGIVWNKELLCYDYSPTDLQEVMLNVFSDGWDLNTLTSFTYAGLIDEVNSGAKVINCSFGLSGKTRNPNFFSQEEIDEAGSIASGYMATLLNNHDFIVVQSAGNAGTDAINNLWWASVTPENCVDWGKGRASRQNILDRILIVGAVQQHENGYMSSIFSCGGDQVNIAAPGGNGSGTSTRDIYSTVTGGLHTVFSIKRTTPIHYIKTSYFFARHKSLFSNRCNSIW